MARLEDPLAIIGDLELRYRVHIGYCYNKGLEILPTLSRYWKSVLEPLLAKVLARYRGHISLKALYMEVKRVTRIREDNGGGFPAAFSEWLDMVDI